MPKQTFFTVRIAAIVALGGFLLGFDASVISGVIKFVEPEFNLTKLQLGWTVGSITLTAAVGMMVAGPLSNTYGRRKLLKVAAILFTVSAIGSALANSFFVLIVARLIGGLGVGAALILAPMYIAEVAPAEKRGQLVSFNQLNIVIGISIAFFTNYLILKWGESDMAWTKAIGLGKWNWRWMLGLETLPAIFYFIGLFFVPRSPRWLIMQNKNDEALETLKKVNDLESAKKQIEEVQQSILNAKKEDKAQLSDIFKPAMRTVITIGLVVGIFQQLVGINAVLFYAPMIFEQTGIGTDGAFVQATLVGFTNLLFTILAILFIDRIGRKPLLVIGMAGITLCLFLLTYGFYSATYVLDGEAINSLSDDIIAGQLAPLVDQVFQDDLIFKAALTEILGEEKMQAYSAQLTNAGTQMNTTLILIGILGFVGSYAFSIGPVMWVLFSELFPNKIRAIAISFVGLVNLGVAFMIQLLFPWELSVLGNTVTFLLYAIFATLGFLFVWLKVPETKGKSLEELEAALVR